MSVTHILFCLSEQFSAVDGDQRSPWNRWVAVTEDQAFVCDVDVGLWVGGKGKLEAVEIELTESGGERCITELVG